jgi:hypothetical protein
MTIYQDTKDEVSAAGTVLRWGITLIVTIGILGFLGNLLGFYSFKFFAPKVEQVRYDTFKQSQAYNDGMVRDLENLRLEYMQANPDQRVAMKAIILHRFSVYDINRLPMDLQAFYVSIQGV